ncbi:hypothetical protein MmiHf6_11990 [Methanimicrococcus hongohii]|uniref:PIN domain-containing protein n=1 Tax=Methanimicrococcus hongohii TaxID=3028295 RepID=A0AA96V043_9EURY|nr:hypothetical protein MmiHf6_11990 [Methanimicrococcus sp. Hf6]
MDIYRSHHIMNVTEKSIFIDANILISLWMPGKKSFLNSYCSRDFEMFLRHQTSLFTDIVVLSEFYNRWLREAYYLYCRKNNLSPAQLKFKDYRQKDDGKITIRQICFAIQIILNDIKIINPNYSRSLLFQNIIDPDYFAHLDFNDLHIISVCLHNDFCLWTNDIDFKGQNIDIFTENGKY